jgi:hypothetical protein
LPFVLGIAIIIGEGTTLALSETGCGCGKRSAGHEGLLAALRACVLDLIENTSTFWAVRDLFWNKKFVKDAHLVDCKERKLESQNHSTASQNAMQHTRLGRANNFVLKITRRLGRSGTSIGIIVSSIFVLFKQDVRARVGKRRRRVEWEWIITDGRYNAQRGPHLKGGLLLQPGLHFGLVGSMRVIGIPLFCQFETFKYGWGVIWIRPLGVV